jgi:D-alanyl-D-alanine carboxypeptidase
LFGRGSREPLRTEHAFRIASMSKTITATVALRLVERGDLTLDRRLTELLPDSIVSRVWMRDGVSRGAEITLRQLLSHTAGLWDFAMSREWQQVVGKVTDPAYFFAPDAILDFALDHGEPVGQPGEKFSYSDTGYVLVGHALERLTDQSYAALCREHVLDPLGMRDTWLEGHEEPRGPALSHPYAGPRDGLEVNGSVDWAAGGHVSTLEDLARLLRGLFEGGLFKSPATLEAMLTTVPADERGGYGLGVGVRELGGQRSMGHSGFWGSFMGYLPDHSATLVGTVNRTDMDQRGLIDEVVRALEL